MRVASVPRHGRAVALRFFAGLGVDETAEVLDVSSATVKREWAFARASLGQALASLYPVSAVRKTTHIDIIIPSREQRCPSILDDAIVQRRGMFALDFGEGPQQTHRASV